MSAFEIFLRDISISHAHDVSSKNISIHIVDDFMKNSTIFGKVVDHSMHVSSSSCDIIVCLIDFNAVSSGKIEIAIRI